MLSPEEVLEILESPAINEYVELTEEEILEILSSLVENPFDIE